MNAPTTARDAAVKVLMADFADLLERLERAQREHGPAAAGIPDGSAGEVVATHAAAFCSLAICLLLRRSR